MPIVPEDAPSVSVPAAVVSVGPTPGEKQAEVANVAASRDKARAFMALSVMDAYADRKASALPRTYAGSTP